MKSRRVDGFFCYADFLSLCRSEWTRRINGGFVDTDFLTVGWLELGSVPTLSNVNLGIVVTAMRKVDVYFSVEVSVVVWKVDVNVCFGVSVFRSEEKERMSASAK